MQKGKWEQKFQNLLLKIPGMKGYQNREAFRDSDKAVRVKLAKELNGVKEVINLWKRDIMDAGKLKGLDVVDRALRKVEGLADRIQYESYGYSGYFDAAQIRDDELEKLYDFDLGLFEKVAKILKAAQDARSGGADNIQAGAKSVEASCDELEQSLKDRHSFEPTPPANL